MAGTSREATVRVAMCQTVCLAGDRSGNVARIERACEEAAAQDAQIACFPETALLGWVNDAAHQRACPIPGPDADRLCALARRFKLGLCVGLAEKEAARLYDSALLIDPEGRILLKHRKLNILTHLMTPPYTPGTEVTVVSTPWGRVGVLICADTFESAHCQALREQRAELVLVPYGWAAPEENWPGHGNELRKVVQSAARQAHAPVVGVDSVGQITCGLWCGWVFGGQSVAVDATGEVLVTLADRDREVRVVDVPVDRRNSGTA